MSSLLTSMPQWWFLYPTGAHTTHTDKHIHSNQVAQTQAHEALVTLSDFGQLKPLKTAATGIENCWEKGTSLCASISATSTSQTADHNQFLTWSSFFRHCLVYQLALIITEIVISCLPVCVAHWLPFLKVKKQPLKLFIRAAKVFKWELLHDCLTNGWIYPYDERENVKTNTRSQCLCIIKQSYRSSVNPLKWCYTCTPPPWLIRCHTASLKTPNPTSLLSPMQAAAE